MVHLKLTLNLIQMCLNGDQVKLNMIIVRMHDIYKSRNAFMQTLHQSHHPIHVRSKCSRLRVSAGRLRLQSVRRRCLRKFGNTRSSWAFPSGRGMGGGSTLRRLGGALLCPFNKGVNLATLERIQGNWTLTKQDHSMFRRMDALESHDLHD